MYDLIIIGAGPAGLTSALYALRANKKVLVLESNYYGGQIINASKIENYPGIENISGFDFATNLYNQVKNLGVELKYETVIKIEENKTVITNDNEYKAKGIIIATGNTNKKLNIERENEFIGKGISYCATCDGNFYKGMDVAVVGGGNTALEETLYLSNIVNKVYLIHRRDSFRGENKTLEELKKLENVEIITNSNITKLNGNELLESIEINNDKEIKVSGLFVAIGRKPENEIFKNLIELDSDGYIKSKDSVHTNIPFIYVAGDARNKKLRQLTTAISDGAIAATTFIEEIN